MRMKYTGMKHTIQRANLDDVFARNEEITISVEGSGDCRYAVNLWGDGRSTLLQLMTRWISTEKMMKRHLWWPEEARLWRVEAGLEALLTHKLRLTDFSDEASADE